MVQRLHAEKATNGSKGFFCPSWCTAQRADGSSQWWREWRGASWHAARWLEELGQSLDGGSGGQLGDERLHRAALGTQSGVARLFLAQWQLSAFVAQLKWQVAWLFFRTARTRASSSGEGEFWSVPGTATAVASPGAQLELVPTMAAAVSGFPRGCCSSEGFAAHTPIQ